MLEQVKAKINEPGRLIGLLVVAVFALVLLIVPPYFGVTQLRPLGVSLFAAIAFSFFHQKSEE